LKPFRKILILLILSQLCLLTNITAQDTLSVDPVKREKTKAEPMKATMMAVIFPGLGQVYNRKYWKIPLVYAGFGGLFYSVGYNTSKYNKYMRAYQDFVDDIPETVSYQDIIPADPQTYDPVLYPDTYDRSKASYYEDGMLRLIDSFRRYRDLSYIGIAAWYMISILDANVDACLVDYDISDNLDIVFNPLLLPLPGDLTGAGVNMTMIITF
jgi:hypothetical protein